jgi:hypothetical protein
MSLAVQLLQVMMMKGLDLIVGLRVQKEDSENLWKKFN